MAVLFFLFPVLTAPQSQNEQDLIVPMRPTSQIRGTKISKNRNYFEPRINLYFLILSLFRVMYIVRRQRTMKESELKIGIKVKAILREDGKHIVVGEILNITLDNHPYQETWVSLNVSGGDVNDDQVHLMIRDNVNVTIPAVDVIGVFQHE